MVCFRGNLPKNFFCFQLGTAFVKLTNGAAANAMKFSGEQAAQVHSSISKV